MSFHEAGADQWSPATPNYPVASGGALWTEPEASTAVAISASRIVLAGGTELDVGTLDASGLQATLAQGEVYLHLRALASGETWSVQTPRGIVTFSGAGRYGVVAGDTQDPTLVTVLEGSAEITATGASLQVAAGQTATITGDQSFQASVGPAQPDAFLTASEQAERPPPVPSVAPPAVVAAMPGGDDLAAYGAWTATPEYGQVWYPQVAAGWVPYRDGHWAYVAPWGWTWIDDAPWGFAPFHYGRWVEIHGRWAWTPGTVQVAAPPVYAPALVAFVGIGVGVAVGAAVESGRVGWFPLGPHEAYHPWYHASETYVREVNRRDVTNVTVINRNVTINNFVNRHAATVVPAAAMAESRPVRHAALRVDPKMLAAARPVVGTAPIRPTAATAGITPAAARQMHLAPAPHGAPVAAHSAAGPAIHPMQHVQGAAARPPLVNHGARPAAAPAAHPAGAAAPPPRSPAGREGEPPPIHAAPAGQAPRQAAPTVQRPGEPRAPEHVVPVAPHPGAAPGPEHRPAAQNGPATHGGVPEQHPMPHVQTPYGGVRVLPETHMPAPAHPTQPPEHHGAPEVHAPAPAVHAPPPVVHAPPPVVHAPAPVVHAPAPVVHAPPPVCAPGRWSRPGAGGARPGAGGACPGAGARTGSACRPAAAPGTRAPSGTARRATRQAAGSALNAPGGGRHAADCPTPPVIAGRAARQQSLAGIAAAPRGCLQGHAAALCPCRSG